MQIFKNDQGWPGCLRRDQEAREGFERTVLLRSGLQRGAGWHVRQKQAQFRKEPDKFRGEGTEALPDLGRAQWAKGSAQPVGPRRVREGRIRLEAVALEDREVLTCGLALEFIDQTRFADARLPGKQPEASEVLARVLQGLIQGT